MKLRTPYHPLIALSLSLILAACGGTDEEADPEPSEPSNQVSEQPGDVLESSKTRELSPEVDDATAEQLTRNNRDFAFSLAAQIRDDEEEEGKNLFFSPHSISIALAMTLGGAIEQTHEQLANTLRFELPEEELHPAFNALDQELDLRGDVEVDEGDPPVLHVVNATWGQRDYPFSEDYLDLLAVNYGAGLRLMDFVADPDGERERINQWVEDQTNERIKDLLPAGVITPLTRLVLTNAIYFLAGWDTPFEEYLTSDEPFYLIDGGEVDAPLMSQTAHYSYYDGEDTRAVVLPYVGGEISLIALKPKDADHFESWEASLDREHFDAVVDGLSISEGRVRIPSFEVEGDYDIKDLFQKMGWTNFSQLDRMLADDFHDDLAITDILHKSFISLDEEGTEAAAATAVVVGRDESAGGGLMFDMRFDRPFYYAIYDHPTDSILFLGRLMNPLE